MECNVTHYFRGSWYSMSVSFELSAMIKSLTTDYVIVYSALIVINQYPKQPSLREPSQLVYSFYLNADYSGDIWS